MDAKKPILIIGAGTVGKQSYDAFNSNSVVVYGFLDDEKKSEELIDEVPVLGKTDDENYLGIIGKDCEVFVASDDTDSKKELVERINKSKKTLPANAIHNNANISPSAFIGYGNLISQGATLGAFSKVSDNCIIHANALIDTNAICEPYVQIGAGAIVNAGTVIGEEAFIGSGSIIVSGVQIGKGARVGAGSVVISDVKAGETVFGNPAQKV